MIYLSRKSRKIRDNLQRCPPPPIICSNSGKWVSLFLPELLDVLLDIEFSDIVLDEGLSEVDAWDLDFGLLWDEIHLSFSFLKTKKNWYGLNKRWIIERTSSWSLREIPLTGPFSILFIRCVVKPIVTFNVRMWSRSQGLAAANTRVANKRSVFYLMSKLSRL